MSRLLDAINYNTYAIGAAASVITALVLWDKQKARRSYPPGPGGYPVVGFHPEWPKGKMWEGFTQMAKEHSE